MGINSPQSDQHFMQLALQQAQLAADADEVPVGAVVVFNGEVIAQAHNQTITQNNPSAHAEILALQQAGLTISNYRLVDCDLYVTLEPCGMCAVACVHARIKRLVYGASDLKTGAIDSVEQALNKPHHNHNVISEGGVLKTACGQIISDFFVQKRLQKKAAKPPS
ncbi:tRNA-specific adenosine-34 deaminase [hydrothermal vent metagenome]|uniref:tRNA(adenine(34)) deaminase n=2 Tax=hydrothermal vent metagenome TaxID=652676 RepID=A0A3B0WFI8_9ZZZZ